MTFIEDLKARGYGKESSAPLETILSTKRGIYHGVDPTADSLQIGNLVSLILMKRLGDEGHRTVFLVGGGTGMIGDPREVGERTLLDKRTLERNKRALRAQLQKIIGHRIELVDNASWLSKLGLLEFLRDIGKHFTVNELIKRDLIRRRLDDPNESISFTEFSYALLQGFDFLTLYKKKGISVQVGGSDQWTNMLSGVELIRRKLGEEAYVFTNPLVTDAGGKKFGKSEGNALWLDPKKTSPFDFYQFWVRLPDAMLDIYLKLFTFLPLSEIETVMRDHSLNPSARKAQKKLAEEVTRLVHGEKALKNALAATEAVHGEHRTIEDLKKHVSSTTVSSGEQKKIIDVLVELNLTTSKSEARRLIEGGGITVNGNKISDVNQTTAAYAVGDHEIRRGNRSAIISIAPK